MRDHTVLAFGGDDYQPFGPGFRSLLGLSTTGNNSLGMVLVAGRKRVPRPAAGTIAVRGKRTCCSPGTVTP
jgi:hypothetical protein